jgi:hypothetical protein
VLHFSLPEGTRSDHLTTFQAYANLIANQITSLPSEQREWTADSRPASAVEFDSVLNTILCLCESLAANKQSLGIASPAGILLVRFNSEWKAAMLDTGFHWRNGPKSPSWMSDATLTKIWQTPTMESRQRASTEFVEQDEVVGFARCLCFALRANCDPPSKEDSPMECWGLMRRATSGELASFSDLRKSLAKSPLSDAFNQRRPRITIPKPRASAWLALPVLGTLVCASYFGIRYYIDHKPGEPVTAQDEQVAEEPEEPQEVPKDLRQFQNRLNALYLQSQDISALVKTSVELKCLYQDFRASRTSPTPSPEEQKWLNICREIAEHLKDFVPGYSLE